MTNEQSYALVIVVIIVAIILASKNRHWIMRVILDRLNINFESGQRKPHSSEQPFTGNEPQVMTAEESEAELQRLQKLIDDRKRVAWNTDISHHLWDLHKNILPHTSPHSLDRYIQDDEWFGLKILHVSTQNGLNTCEFELKEAKYKFVDDEEKQNWREHSKFFSLYLYDDSDRCLIEIPMKMKVDGSGRHYSILSGGPSAFLPGGWINDLIHVKLKHQSIRNQEIRLQKHQERLSEIEDLKERFGIVD